MKKLILLSLTLLTFNMAHAGQYIEGNFVDGLGFRMGYQGKHIDASFGLTDSETDDITLKTMSGEVYKVFGEVVKFKLGGGLGYTIPQVPSNGLKADTDVSYIIGGGMEYPITENWSIGGSIKGLFFKSDTRLTTYGSHMETLSNGTPVEVIDVYHEYSRRNYNSLLLGVAIRYAF